MSSGQESDLLLLLGSVPGAWGEVEGLGQLWGAAHESHRLPSLTTLCSRHCAEYSVSHQHPICPCPGSDHLDFRLTWSPALQVEIPM